MIYNSALYCLGVLTETDRLTLERIQLLILWFVIEIRGLPTFRIENVP